MGDRVVDPCFLDAACEPLLLDQRLGERVLLGADRPVVEVGRIPGDARLPVLGQLHELQPLGDDLPLPVIEFAGVLDRVLDVDEGARVFALVGVGDEHRALFEERPVALQHHVHGRVEQRMPWGEQLRLRLPVRCHQRLLERHARVARDDRDPRPERLASVADLGGDVRDLVAAGLALGDLTAEQPERFQEEGADVVGLQLACLRDLHLPPDLLDIGGAHHLGEQRPLLQRGLQLLADGGIDDLVEPRSYLRLVAVADSTDQQVAQRILEDLVAEHVEDAATQLLRLLRQLLQQPLEHLALTGLERDQVPHVADLGLADPVDASEALLDPVRVPGQVVVHEQMSALQVHALPGRVRRDKHEHVGFLQERLLRFASKLAAHPTVDLDHRLRPAEQCSDAAGQVVERVAMLGEDDQLPALPRFVEHLRLTVLQQLGKARPLRIGSGQAHLVRELLKPAQGVDLVAEFGDRLRRRRLIDDLLLQLLQLAFGQVVDVLRRLEAERQIASAPPAPRRPRRSSFSRNSSRSRLRRSDW